MDMRATSDDDSQEIGNPQREKKATCLSQAFCKHLRVTLKEMKDFGMPRLHVHRDLPACKVATVPNSVDDTVENASNSWNTVEGRPSTSSLKYMILQLDSITAN